MEIKSFRVQYRVKYASFTSNKLNMFYIIRLKNKIFKSFVIFTYFLPLIS